MSVQVSLQAHTALTWAFGAYAATDPGIPFDIALAVDIELAEPSSEEVDTLAKNLIQAAINQGMGNRLMLGWCTFVKDGRFGLGVMALQPTSQIARPE